ncbi:hypothetical protein R1flu_012879 [Riccia fluitans]|uniref:Uncharacterized protein n=1 Tax=Riccia fluitans TaxID=41844 RepID=A0ABD1ZF91_9MARC
MKRPAANQVSGSPIRRRLRDECSFQGSSSGTTFQASDSSQALQSIVQGYTKTGLRFLQFGGRVLPRIPDRKS